MKTEQTSPAPSETANRLPQVGDTVYCKHLDRTGKFTVAGHMMFTIEWQGSVKEQLELGQIAHLDYVHGSWLV